MHLLWFEAVSITKMINKGQELHLYVIKGLSYGRTHLIPLQLPYQLLYLNQCHIQYQNGFKGCQYNDDPLQYSQLQLIANIIKLTTASNAHFQNTFVGAHMKMGSQMYVRSECVQVLLLEGAPAIACAPPILQCFLRH